MEEEKIEVQKVSVARLNSQRVYLGVEQKPADQLLPSDVQVPVDCDLEPGMYEWDWNAKAFAPLMHLWRARHKEEKLRRAAAGESSRDRKAGQH